MKKYLLFSIVILILSFAKKSYSQCPGCVIDTSCSPAGGFGICPNDTIKLTAYKDTSVNLTFVVPTQYDDPSSGITVDVNYVEVSSINGMPVGLNWECNNLPNCHYDGGSMGCALVCGTPISPPGIYVATVNLNANVSVVGNTTTSFDLIFEILPASSNNFAFSYSPTQGCLPLVVNFTNNIPSGGNPNYTYTWDFGNGYQSSLENPNSQTYDTAGNYIISYQVEIDTAQYYFSDVAVLGASCDDGGLSDPDYYYILKQNGNVIVTSQTITNHAPPTNIPTNDEVLQDSTYVLEVWDEDGGLAGADDYCGDINFNGHSSGAQTLSNGSLVVSITIQHPIVTFTEVDTISVFNNPPLPNISYIPNDSVCGGDFVELSSSAMSDNQWFNQNGIIAGADSVVYNAGVSGNYFVRVTNSNGCFSDSPVEDITIVSNPFKPTFWINYDTLTTNSTDILQWYFYDNFNATPIAGGTTNKLIVSQTGFYFLTATNYFGCISSSDTVYVTSYSINENFKSFDVNIYPNPAHQQVTFEFYNNININKIVILNTLLQTVKEITVDENKLNVKEIVNIENEKKGVYFVKFVSKSNIFTKKLIIN